MTSLSLGANDIVDTNGFETGFVLGSLQGQQDWVTVGNGGGTATIQGSVTQSGSRAVRVDRGANSDDYWAVQVGNMSLPTNRYILIDWDMNVPATGAASATGPFFGVTTFDDTTSVKALGSLGVDATTGDILYQEQTTGGVLTETGMMVNPGQWYHFQIRLDFFLNEYQVFLDFSSTPLATSGFVDGPTDVFTDADITAITAALDGDSQIQMGTAYFDNFLVRNVDQPDFDIDGDVDATDLSLWENAFGLSAGADADLDSDSDGVDFLIWQRGFDDGVSPLVAPIFAVPEPNCLALALLPLFAGLRLRCRSMGASSEVS